MITAIHQVAVNVKDVERAKGFYRDKLGIRHLFDGGPKLSFFDCGGVRLMLGPADTPEFDHPSSIFYFRVEDIRAAHREMVGKGVKFRDDPHFVPTGRYGSPRSTTARAMSTPSCRSRR